MDSEHPDFFSDLPIDCLKEISEYLDPPHKLKLLELSRFLNEHLFEHVSIARYTLRGAIHALEVLCPNGVIKKENELKIILVIKMALKYYFVTTRPLELLITCAFYKNQEFTFLIKFLLTNYYSYLIDGLGYAFVLSVLYDNYENAELIQSFFPNPGYFHRKTTLILCIRNKFVDIYLSGRFILSDVIHKKELYIKKEASIHNHKEFKRKFTDSQMSWIMNLQAN